MKYPYSSYNTPLPGYGTSLVDRINLYLHFRRYFKILAERWLLIVIFTLLGTGIAVFQAINKPDIFKAQSVLQVTPKVTVAGTRRYHCSHRQLRLRCRTLPSRYARDHDEKPLCCRGHGSQLFAQWHQLEFCFLQIFE